MRVIGAEQLLVDHQRLAVARLGGGEIGAPPGQDGEIVERQRDLSRRRLRLAAQQLERPRVSRLRRLEIALLVGERAEQVEGARQIGDRRRRLSPEDASRRGREHLPASVEAVRDRCRPLPDATAPRPPPDRPVRVRALPSRAPVRGAPAAAARSPSRQVMPPRVSWSRAWISGSSASWRVIRWPPRSTISRTVTSRPCERFGIGLLEEIDEELDHAVGGLRLAVGARRLTLEIDGEALGVRAGAFLAHREVGDNGENDGQQGKRDRERGDLQTPPPQPLRLVEQEAQPLEALVGRRPSRRNGVLQVLDQARDLGIDAVGGRDRQASVLGDAHEQLRQRLARVGGPAGQQLLQQDAEREHVARLGELLSRGLLRAHVENGPDDRPLLGERRREGGGAGVASGKSDCALGIELAKHG